MSSAVYSRFVGSSQSSILLRSPLRQWEMRLPVRLNARPWIRILNPAIMAALIILLGVTVVRQGFAETDYVRFSKPDLLTFEELVALEQEDPPSDALAAKLEHLLATPVVSNEAYLGGAKPKRASSPQLGPFLRAICWNIERGIQFDAIRIA